MYRGFLSLTFFTILFASVFSQDDLSPLDAYFTSYEIFKEDTESLVSAIQSTETDEISLKILGWEMKLTRSSIIDNRYKTRILTENGVQEVFTEKAVPLKGYTLQGGQVSITIGQNFIQGYVKTGMYTFYIEPLYHFIKGAEKDVFILYNTKDIIPGQEKKCGVGPSMEGNHRPERSSGQRGVLTGECFEVEWALASDFAMFNHHGSVTAVENHNIAVANDIQTNYDDEFADEVLFVIVEQYVITTSGGDPWTSSTDGGTLLGSFRNWAPSGFNSTHDLGSLWTKRTLNNNVVGIAYVGAVCTGSRYNVLTDFTTNAAQKRVMVAHEIGHNFDAVHDASGSGFIMAPSVNTSTIWSSASITDIEAHYTSRTCLADCPPTTPEIYFLSSGVTVSEVGTFSDTSFCGAPYTTIEIPVRLSLASTSVNEVEVEILAGSTAIQNIDYILENDTLTFPSGSATTQNITVLIANDAIEESDETIELTLNSISGPAAIGAADTFQLTITDLLDAVSDTCCTPGDFTTYGNYNYNTVFIFNSAYQDSRSRYLYLPSQLTAAGMSAGLITGLGVYVQTKNSTQPFQNFRVGMKNVDFTTLDGQSWITTDEVFENDYTTTTSSWNVIDFDNDFYWDGTSAIYLEFCFDNSSTSANSDIVRGTSPVGGGSGDFHEWRQSNTVNLCSSLSGSIWSYTPSTIQPQLRFYTLGGARIENTAGKTSKTYIRSGETAHIYSDDRKVIASLTNIGPTDIECLEISVSSAGNSQQTISGSSVSYAQKTIQVNGDQNSLYELSLYYTQTQMNTWGTDADKLNMVSSEVPFSSTTLDHITIFRPDTIYNNIGPDNAWVYKGTFNGNGWYSLTNSELPVAIQMTQGDLVLTEGNTGVILKNKTGEAYLITVGSSGSLTIAPAGNAVQSAILDKDEWGWFGAGRGLILRNSNNNYHRITVSNTGQISTQSVSSLPAQRMESSSQNLMIEPPGGAIVLKSSDGACWRVFVNENGQLRSVKMKCP